MTIPVIDKDGFDNVITRFRRVRRTLLGLLPIVTAVAWADSSTGTATAADVCALSDKLVNPCRPWLGGNAGAYPDVESGPVAQTEAHEARIGRQVDVVHLFNGVGTTPLTDAARHFATRPNTILSQNWKPAAAWSDANGSNATVNASIDAAAASIKSLGVTKIMLTLHHEPEDNVSGGAAGCDLTYKGTSGTPADYRAMWQNVRARFDAAGVTNVVWVMNYMGFTKWDCMVDDLWPGNGLVDWVMWDPYSETTPWSETVGRFYSFLSSTSNTTHDYLAKPWGLHEWGTWRYATQPFTYEYYDAARASIAAGEFPRLKLYSVFDNGVDEPKTSRIAYASNDAYDQTEVEHYRALANAPVFLGAWSSGPGDNEAPTAPTALTESENTVSQVTLQWAAATDNVSVDHYQVFRNGSLLAADVTATSYADSTVAASTTYTYAVRAVDDASNVGPFSADLSVTTPAAPDTQAPTAPTKLNGTAGTGSVSLRWVASTDNVGVTGYHVYRNGALAATVTGTSHVDNNLTSRTTYKYTVRAVDAAGNISASSNAVNVRTK